MVLGGVCVIDLNKVVKLFVCVSVNSGCLNQITVCFVWNMDRVSLKGQGYQNSSKKSVTQYSRINVMKMFPENTTSLLLYTWNTAVSFTSPSRGKCSLMNLFKPVQGVPRSR